MNREQAREMASKVLMSWLERGASGSGVNEIADALHAAYEAERVAPVDARLASIKETARRIWAGYFVGPDDEDSALRGLYPEGWDDKIAADCDAAVRFAEALEDAFERRYGGKP